jgi:sugar transferase EpsL
MRTFGTINTRMPLFPPQVPYTKRIFDLVVSLVGGILISPVLLVVSLLVYFSHGSPVLFRQRRPGIEGKPFINYKYRTMLDTRDEQGQLLPDAQRLTRLGRFLRNTSLDEWPELLNVLRGEMSLVGPRPLLMQYLDRYSAEQARRHEVLPGITGWAQVNGRNALSWEEKFRLDVWYIDHWSFLLDVKILLLTMAKVIRSEGISQPGFSTAEEFMGSIDLPEQADISELHQEIEKENFNQQAIK